VANNSAVDSESDISVGLERVLVGVKIEEHPPQHPSRATFQWLGRKHWQERAFLLSSAGSGYGIEHNSRSVAQLSYCPSRQSVNVVLSQSQGRHKRRR
jgi:hypothetical protein